MVSPRMLHKLLTQGKVAARILREGAAPIDQRGCAPRSMSFVDLGGDGAHEVEVPEGACPIFPAGAHQVKNVGEEDAHVLFIEAFPTCKPCGDVEGFLSPFTVAPQCYKVLAENNEYYTGMLTMQPGESDPVHHHKVCLVIVKVDGESWGGCRGVV